LGLLHRGEGQTFCFVQDFILRFDEDMATMLMSMHGAWIGEDGVHQSFPSE
jgi:hypothetical protein